MQGLEIEYDTIRCTDDTELQVLIASVRRLLQLFPQVKDSVKKALSSYEIVNWFYRDETRRYMEQINQSPLHFKADTLNLSQFLNSDEKTGTSATDVWWGFMDRNNEGMSGAGKDTLHG